MEVYVYSNELSRSYSCALHWMECTYVRKVRPFFDSFRTINLWTRRLQKEEQIQKTKKIFAEIEMNSISMNRHAKWFEWRNAWFMSHSKISRWIEFKSRIENVIQTCVEHRISSTSWHKGSNAANAILYWRKKDNQSHCVNFHLYSPLVSNAIASGRPNCKSLSPF